MSPRARANLARLVIGLAVVAGVVWFVTSRGDKSSRRTPTVVSSQRSSGEAGSAGTDAPGASGKRGGGGGGGGGGW